MVTEKLILGSHFNLPVNAVNEPGRNREYELPRQQFARKQGTSRNAIEIDKKNPEAAKVSMAESSTFKGSEILRLWQGEQGKLQLDCPGISGEGAGDPESRTDIS